MALDGEDFPSRWRAKSYLSESNALYVPFFFWRKRIVNTFKNQPNVGIMAGIWPILGNIGNNIWTRCLRVYQQRNLNCPEQGQMGLFLGFFFWDTPLALSLEFIMKNCASQTLSPTRLAVECSCCGVPWAVECETCKTRVNDFELHWHV